MKNFKYLEAIYMFFVCMAIANANMRHGVFFILKKGKNNDTLTTEELANFQNLTNANLTYINESLLQNINITQSILEKLERIEQRLDDIEEKQKMQCVQTPSTCPVEVETESPLEIPEEVETESPLEIPEEVPSTPVITEKPTNKLKCIYDSCASALMTNPSNGVYHIKIPNNSLKSFKVYCFKDIRDDNVWTVIQRRFQSPNMLDFRRTWKEYKDGFGDLVHEHWLGLEKIYALTNHSLNELYVVTVTESGKVGHERIDKFAIENESNNYRLTSLGNLKSGSPFKYCLNSDFVTYDRDVDRISAKNGGTGYWSNCTVNINSQVIVDGQLQIKFRFKDEPVSILQMAIAPSKSNLDAIEY